MKTDVRPLPITDEDEHPGRIFHARRVVRWIVVLTLGIVAVLAAWQEPLHALR